MQITIFLFFDSTFLIFFVFFYRNINKMNSIPDLHFMKCGYRIQCAYCWGSRITCIIHRLENNGTIYKKRLYQGVVGQNDDLMRIIALYFHQFKCGESENCTQTVCLDCEAIINDGDVSQHVQYEKIRKDESWVVRMISELLKVMKKQHINDELGLVHVLKQEHVVLQEKIQREY